MTELRRSTLANGIAVITRTTPGAHSTAVGLWLFNGARHEAAEQHGWAHLLEHLFFKGCGNRDAAEIARLTDRWGGLVNAFTGRELTALHGLVPANKQIELTQLLIDMVCNPRFSDLDLAAEQGVILQEIASVEDAPEEAAEIRLVASAWRDHPIGRDILGTPESVRAATVAALQDYRSRLLCAERLAVVAVGAVDHDALVKACETLAALPRGERPAVTPPQLRSGQEMEIHDSHQAQLLWALPAPAASAAELPAAVLVNHVLGGGVSSRLFQELRERMGLVYDIRSSVETYSDCGFWLIQTACEPAESDQCRRAVHQTVLELQDSVRAEELADARDHIAAILTLEQDTLESYMERLAREHFYLGRHPSLEEDLERVSRVTVAECQELLTTAWQQSYELIWRSQD